MSLEANEENPGRYLALDLYLELDDMHRYREMPGNIKAIGVGFGRARVYFPVENQSQILADSDPMVLSSEHYFFCQDEDSHRL